MWHVYIVQCKDNSYYTGIAKNVERRIHEHQSQSKKCAKYLRGKAPITLLYSEQHNDRSSASKREIAIKKLSRQDKQALITRCQEAQ